LLLLIICSYTLFEAALVPEIHLTLHDGFWDPHSSQLTWSRGAAPHISCTAQIPCEKLSISIC